MDTGDSISSSVMLFDPIHVVSSWNMPLRLEAATRLAADSIAAKSNYAVCMPNNELLWKSSSLETVNSFGESAIRGYINELDQTPSYTSSLNLMKNSSSEAKSYMSKRSHGQALFESDLENQPKYKKATWENKRASSSNMNAIEQMKESFYEAVNFSREEVVTEKPKKRKNVRISKDPQTVAARKRRERISQRIRVLQKLVPGCSKMDTASMLEEAANYLKFLRTQIKAFEAFAYNATCSSIPYFNYPFPMQTIDMEL